MKCIHTDLVQHSWCRSTLALWRFLWNHRLQRTWAFCPRCHVDLCSNNSLQRDGEEVVYQCSNCGTVSEWDFDLPCGPVLLHTKAPTH